MKQLNLLIISAVLLSGCAGVKLYKKENFTERTGLKFYYPKPYLLVEINGAKDVPLKTTLIFLPDISNPVYAKTISGFGSNELSIALTNGALSSYGVKTDSKIPETIAGAGGLLTGIAGVMTAGAAKSESLAAKKQSEPDMTKVKNLVDGVNADLVYKPIVFPDFITLNQKNDFESAKTEIKNTQTLAGGGGKISVKALIESLDKVIKNLEGVKCGHETDACKNFNGKFISLINQLTAAKEILQPKEANSSTFELYEIISNGSWISYKLVKPVPE